MKIHEIFCENSPIIFVLFYDVHKENMFTINLEEGREAPTKASIIKKTMIKLYKQRVNGQDGVRAPVLLRTNVKNHLTGNKTLFI